MSNRTEKFSEYEKRAIFFGLEHYYVAEYNILKKGVLNTMEELMAEFYPFKDIESFSKRMHQNHKYIEEDENNVSI